MGKVKPRILGDESVELEQKKEQKEKAAQRKAAKKKKAEGAEAVKETKKAAVGEEKKETPKAAAKIEKKTSKTKKSNLPSAKPRGKKYQEVRKMVEDARVYQLAEAVTLVKKMKTAKFDESMEIHLVVDETGLKGEVELPHSTGKSVKVAVVDDKVLAEIEAGKIDFDILVTHPSFMPKLAKYAKVLGPRGLMPNPKAGTISPKPEEVVKKFAKGVLRWKTEAKAPLIHQMIGKVSADDKSLVENATKFIDTVGRKHILKAYLTSTMSPSVKLAIQ